MHLPTLPTIFVKDGIERKIYHTVEARELTAAGWVERGQDKGASKRIAKPAEKITEEKPQAEKVKAAPAKPVIKTAEVETEK
jgi:hypothetical protein